MHSPTTVLPAFGKESSCWLECETNTCLGNARNAGEVLLIDLPFVLAGWLVGALDMFNAVKNVPH